MAATSSATIINIPADYPTIQQGIDASADGDTVLVQPGIYAENVQFSGSQITVASLYLTTGDTTYKSTTIIEGDYLLPVVLFNSDEDTATSIMGFTLRHGTQNFGSAIECDQSSPKIIDNIITANSPLHGAISCISFSNPVITSNIIRENSGSGIYCTGHTNAVIVDNLITDNTDYGIRCTNNSDAYISNNFIIENQGGIVFANSNPVIEDNFIVYNFGVNGAGIHCYNSGGLIRCNLIDHNSVEIFGPNDGGGGIYCDYSNPKIENNIISNNSANGYLQYFAGGGALYINGSDPIVCNNLFLSNSTGSRGGGIYYYAFSTYPARIINNTFYLNYAGDRAGAICCNGPESAEITNSILVADSCPSGEEIFFQGSMPVVTYSNIQGGWAGNGNIDIDPLFRDAVNYDFHLMSTACGDPYDSPCIDGGDPNIFDSLLDCSWGLGGARSDMGAYGGGDTAYVAIWDLPSSLPDRFTILQNYPNPFNAQTTIRFVLPRAQEVELSVYDLLGRQIEVLIDEYLEAGSYKVEFDASSLSSGVYFYRLRAGDKIETKRMVLLK